MKPGAPDAVLRPSPGSGQRGSLQAREVGLGEKMAASGTLSGALPCSGAQRGQADSNHTLLYPS